MNAEVSQNLEDINSQIRKVSVVMEEIATASEQQNQGVEQITGAVEQINSVTQQAAANSEESAAAAEELSGQSQEMLSLIGNFTLLGDSRSKSRSSVSSGKFHQPAAMSFAVNPTKGVGKTTRQNGRKSSFVPTDDVESMIPFGDMNDSVLSEF